LCRVRERSQWAHDPRFATFADRARHRDQLTALLDELLRERTTDEWVARLTAASIPCAPINDVGGALGDPQSIAREAVGRYEHPRLGTVRQVRTPFRLAGVDRDLRPAPALGADTTAVLRELCGWDEARVARLSTVRGD
jgi:crotonobetainyl-CoA:carnitine CoA-transferase CaiB-like acyl-CoA transferase